MPKPLPKSQLKIKDAIQQLIATEFRERDQYIKSKIALEIGRETIEGVATEHSREISDLISDLIDDARSLLRQWLRDGRIRAFYSDPRRGGDVELHPSAWGLAITDSAIKGGDYVADGDPRFAGPVGLHYVDFFRIVIGGEEVFPALEASQAMDISRIENSLTLPLAIANGGRADENSIVPAPSFLDQAITKPTGKDRKREGARMALQAIYGPGMGRGLAYKVQLNAVRQWYTQQGWEVPSFSARTFDRILNPRKDM